MLGEGEEEKLRISLSVKLAVREQSFNIELQLRL
jgi:hypothetical protein